MFSSCLNMCVSTDPENDIETPLGNWIRQSFPPLSSTTLAR